MVQNILKPMSSHNYGTAATEQGNYPVAPYNAEVDEINVTASTSSVVILPSNAARTNATFWNNSTSICYVNLGATSSSGLYTTEMAPGGTYTLPLPIYTGIVSAIWVSANGSMQGTAS